MAASRGWLAFIAAGALALAGCSESEPEAEAPLAPAEVVPRDALMYAESTVRLRGEVGGAARRFIGDLTGTAPVPEGAVAELIVRAAGTELDFERDLAPWLGDRAGVFAVETARDPVAIGLVAPTPNPEAALKFIRAELGSAANREMYKGVRVWRGADGRAGAMVRGRAILGSSAEAVHASIDTRGRALADMPGYRHLASGPAAPFAVVMADAARLRALVDRIGLPAERRDIFAVLPRSGEVAARLDIDNEHVRIAADGLRIGARPPTGIGDMPGDAWLAVSTTDVHGLLTSPGVESGFLLRRILGAVLGAEPPTGLVRQFRRGTFYLQGGRSEPSGELVVEVGNVRATDRAMRRFAARLRRFSGKTVEVFRSHRADLGVLTYQPGRESADPPLSETFLNDRKMSLVFGPIGASEELRETPLYRRAKSALGEPPTAVVDVRALREFLDGPDPPQGQRKEIQLVAVAEGVDGQRGRWVFAVRLTDVPPRPDS